MVPPLDGFVGTLREVPGACESQTSRKLNRWNGIESLGAKQKMRLKFGVEWPSSGKV
jgi:hypothetical protein